jgi:hypothetical protein
VHCTPVGLIPLHPMLAVLSNIGTDAAVVKRTIHNNEFWHNVTKLLAREPELIVLLDSRETELCHSRASCTQSTNIPAPLCDALGFQPLVHIDAARADNLRGFPATGALINCTAPWGPAVQKRAFQSRPLRASPI